LAEGRHRPSPGSLKIVFLDDEGMESDSSKAVRTMILVNERQGYRVCLECHEPLGQGEDQTTWMRQHVACARATAEPAPAA
jgi:hypothetical protein